MPSHEYRVVPAPRRGAKARGVRSPEARFARAVESEMNRMAAQGWEFVRSDTLPCEQKGHWFSRPVTVFQTLLVFRRALPVEAAVPEAPATVAAPMPPPVALTPPLSVAAPAHPSPAPAPPLPAWLGTEDDPPPQIRLGGARRDEPAPERAYPDIAARPDDGDGNGDAPRRAAE